MRTARAGFVCAASTRSSAELSKKPALFPLVPEAPPDPRSRGLSRAFVGPRCCCAPRTERASPVRGAPLAPKRVQVTAQAAGALSGIPHKLSPRQGSAVQPQPRSGVPWGPQGTSSGWHRHKPTWERVRPRLPNNGVGKTQNGENSPEVRGGHKDAQGWSSSAVGPAEGWGCWAWAGEGSGGGSWWAASAQEGCRKAGGALCGAVGTGREDDKLTGGRGR